jgi:hypothetical protein
LQHLLVFCTDLERKNGKRGEKELIDEKLEGDPPPKPPYKPPSST